MKVGIFGSKYQVDRQDLIKCLFDALRKRGAEVYVDAPFHSFLTVHLTFLLLLYVLLHLPYYHNLQLKY